MNVLVDFENDYLLSRAARDREVIFAIFWEHDGVCYPERGWTDFGAVILVWWLDATWRLREGATDVTYRFMDGPYGIRASLERDTGTVALYPEGERYGWSTTLDQLIRALIVAATTVRDKLGQLGIGEKDRDSLEFGIDRLR